MPPVARNKQRTRKETTYWLRISCSTSWATPAFSIRLHYD